METKFEGLEIEAEMNYQLERQGYKIVEIPMTNRCRLGEKKLNLRHGFSILKRIIAASLSKRYHS